MFSRYLTALGLVASVLSLTAEAQTPVATSNLLINRADGSDGSDQTQIFRADPAENQGELRLQIGDDGSDDVFNIGYRYWASGEWISNFKFRADGNATFRGNLGLGVDNPAYKLDVNGKALFRENIDVRGNASIGYKIVFPDAGNRWDGRTDSGEVSIMRFYEGSKALAQGLAVKLASNWDGYKWANSYFGVTDVYPEDGRNPRLLWSVNNKGDEAARSISSRTTIAATGDISTSAKLIAKGDISTQGKVIATGDISTQGKVIATSDISTNGNLFAKGRLYVGTAGWSISAPDYVFDEGYSLLPIDSVISYVKTNKHLPGVPSAKEMETAEKQDLVEMNMLLLKKMEEMTLYIGELNARVSKMEKNADREVK
ncbi:MAG: hypothetical protein IPK50_23540 [Fibrobacterota bacterium]|nr:MAG: hypothetical protein IPK50_23540 [Fibrobacterota bacterium]